MQVYYLYFINNYYTMGKVGRPALPINYNSNDYRKGNQNGYERGVEETNEAFMPVHNKLASARKAIETLDNSNDNLIEKLNDMYDTTFTKTEVIVSGILMFTLGLILGLLI